MSTQITKHRSHKGVFGVPKKYFLTDAIARRIRADYKRVSTITIAADLGVPCWQVTRFAKALGLSRVKEPPWAEKELAFLAAVRPLTTVPIAATVLDRSIEAVKIICTRKKINRCRIKRGQEFGFNGLLCRDQVEAIWKDFDAWDGRIPIPADPARNGGPRRIWSRAEIDYVKEHAGQQSVHAIARRLGRSIRAIEHRLHYLGIGTLDNQGYLNTTVVKQVLGVRSTTPIYAAIKRGFLKPLRPGKKKRYFVFDPAEVERLRALREAGRRGSRCYV